MHVEIGYGTNFTREARTEEEIRAEWERFASAHPEAAARALHKVGTQVEREALESWGRWFMRQPR